jgi:hypothetical protein
MEIKITMTELMLIVDMIKNDGPAVVKENLTTENPDKDKPENPLPFGQSDPLDYFYQKAMHTIWMVVRDEISEQAAYNWIDNALDNAINIQKRNS